MEFKELFGKTPQVVSYSPDLARILGNDTDAALFVCQLIFWNDKKLDKEGWIRKSHEELDRALCMSRSRQDRVRKKLLSQKWIQTTRKKALPAKMGYKLQIDKIRQDWEEYKRMGVTKSVVDSDSEND